MARPKNKYPVPTLRLKDGVWRIRWRDCNERYEFSTGCREADEDAAEKRRLEAARALRNDADWPEWADSIPVVQRWRAKDAVAATESNFNGIDALDGWLRHYASFASPQQAEKRRIQMLALAGQHNLLTLSPSQAADFFTRMGDTPSPLYLAGKIALMLGGKSMTKSEIITSVEASGADTTVAQIEIALRNKDVFKRTPPPRKDGDNTKPSMRKGGTYSVVRARQNGLAPSTRNDYLQSFNMFYDWAIDQGILKDNPFRKIKPARVEAHAEIVWLTRDERDAITRASESLDCRLSVWIALYAGLRLGEIARLRWEDVDLAGRWIHVKKSKTGKTRRVPISGALLEVLRAAERKSGFVCPHWQDGDYHVKADSDILPVTKALPALADKLRWNVFRHTFASLLAQTGKVSIDQISALMGNTPEVCRRHYAHLIPDAVERTGIDLID